MAENPFQGSLNPNLARGSNLWDLRMMSAANRMESPFERGARGAYGHQGLSGNPMLAGLMGMSGEPDYSQFTYDPAMRQRAMDAGVQPLEASQVKQNAVLPNTGFFGSHPRLSGVLEGGMFGALAAHGGSTPGDSIQGALEGLVGGQRVRQGMLRQQFARPFEAAGMLEGIADMKQKRDLQSAEIEHYRALNQKLGRPDHDFRPMGNAGPQDKTIPIMDNTTGQLTTPVNPNYDPELMKQMHRQAGAGTDFDRWVEMSNAERAKSGKPPMNSRDILDARGKWGAASAGPSTAARDAAGVPYQNYSDARREHDKRMDGFQNKILKSDDPNHQSAARDTILQQRMSEAMQARANGQNYSKSLIPSEQDVKDYIKTNNDDIQRQIDAEQAGFNNAWPQALETPGAPKVSSPKRGSSGRTPIYNRVTGKLE